MICLITEAKGCPLHCSRIEQLGCTTVLQKVHLAAWRGATGAIALVFALSIVAAQALRASQANPVNSLRNE